MRAEGIRLRSIDNTMITFLRGPSLQRKRVTSACGLTQAEASQFPGCKPRQPLVPLFLRSVLPENVVDEGIMYVAGR